MMTVWTLCWSLFRLVLRGQGKYPVFVDADEQLIRDLAKEGKSLKEIMFGGQPWRIDDVWSDPPEEFVVLTASKVDY